MIARGLGLFSALSRPQRAEVDLVADLRAEQVRPLVAMLSEAYYVDEDRVRAATAARLGSQVDRDHLRRWAAPLGVVDLLERALAEAA